MSSEDRSNGVAPPLTSFAINWGYRYIILALGFLLIIPLVIAFWKNKALLPPLLILLALFLIALWIISRYEIFFLRRGLSENFLRFYSLPKLFHEELEFPQLASRICEELANWLRCRKVYFFVIDEALGKCQPIARIDLETWEENSIPLDDPLISYLAMSQTPLPIPPGSNLRTDLGFRILLPIRAKGKLGGFLAFGEKSTGEPFYRIELKNLEILASQLSLFLEKENYKKTLRRQLKELTSAQEILTRTVANPYHLDSILEGMVESLRLLFPQVRLIEICLWDEKEKKMVVRKASGPGITEGYKYNLGEGLSGIIARDRKPILVIDSRTLKDKLKVPVAGPFRSFVGVPLIHQGKLIGSLEMDSLYPEAFKTEDLRFLESLAPYFAAIIYNSQTHYLMVKEKEALLEAYKLLSKMLTSGLKGEELLTHTAGMINTFMDSDACAIRVWDKEGNLNSYWAGSESILPPPKWEIDLCSRQDEVMLQEMERPGSFSDMRGMKAFIATSIYLKGEKIGWIGVWKRDPKAFSNAEMNWLKAFSAQVAAMCERIALQRELEKASQELDSLRHLKIALEKSSSLEEMAREGLKAIIEYFKLEGIPCCLLFFDSKGEHAIAMSPSFNPHLAESLAFLSPTHPAEPEALTGLGRYLKNLKIFPVEFGGKAWGLFAFYGGKIPDISLHLHHLGSEAARFHLKNELEEVKENFIKFLRAVSDGLYLAGTKGEILDFDDKLCALTGFARDEMLKNNCRLLYPPETIPPVLESLRNGEIILKSTHIKAKDGHLVPVRETVIPLSPEKAAVAFWDLSQEKDLEKLQDVVTIFLTHEIGKLVNRLSSGLYLYKEKRKALDEVIELSDKLIETVRKFNDLINLERGKIRLKLVKLDVAKLAKNVMERFAEQSSHRFSFEEPEEELLALGDEKLVEIILSNLLDNAVKYSSPGSLVTVKVEAHGDEVKVSVKDEGVGIPVPLQRKIFEKYYRIETKETAKVSGLGLGLYFCKLIVEAHGGKIWVESLPGCGSTFAFTLPRTHPQP